MIFLLPEDPAQFWTPLNLGVNLRLFYSGASPSSLTYDGSNYLSEVRNLAVNANHLYQTTNSYKPLYDPINKCFDFANSGQLQYLRNTSPTALGYSGISWTLFCAGQAYSSASYNNFGHLISVVTNGGYQTETFGIAGNTQVIITYPFEGVAINYNLQNKFIIIVTSNGKNYNTIPYINGELKTFSFPSSNYDLSLSNTSNLRVTVGAWDAFEHLFKGKIYAVGLIYGALSTNNRQKLEGWLASTFAMQNVLASNHPYKNYLPLI